MSGPGYSPDAIVHVESIGEIVKMVPVGASHEMSLISKVQSVFETYLSHNQRFFIIDLACLKELSPAFIVLLFETTARVRRIDGDCTLINVGKSSRNSLLTFNATSYLEIFSDEETAIAEFRQRFRHRMDVFPAPNGPDFRVPGDQYTSRKSIEIPSQVNALYRACDFVLNFLQNTSFDEAEMGKIKIAVYEACLNAIEHAYHSDPNQVVRVTVEKDHEKAVIAVIDRGDGFNVNKNEDFDIVRAAKNRKRGGMGLHIIRRSMDDVDYRIDPVMGNKLVMVKYFTILSNNSSNIKSSW